MIRKRKILLRGLFALALVLSGGAYYAWYCFSHMSLRSFTGPQEARAQKQQYTCGMHPFVIQDEPGNCPICGMKLTPLKAGTVGGAAQASAKPKGERKIKYWVAPMDPTYIRHEPGKSPMGMDLVPVYEDEAPSGSVISIDPVTMQNMGIKTARADRMNLQRDLRTVGLIAYDEARQYSINSKIQGWVERLYVDQTGQFVKKGQPLLAIYSPDLVSAQQEYLLALNNNKALAKSDFPQIAQGAQSLLEASRSRLRYWDISDRQIDELERTGKVRKTMTLYAPYDGIVTMKMVNEGMDVKAGMELFKFSDISRVWIYADIYEYELPWLKLGQKAKVEFPYADMPSLSGRVTYIYPYVEPKTRTVKVRLEFDNPGYQLKPDQYVNVHIATHAIENVLVIPSDAVLFSGEKRTVFVALGGGKFEPRRIKTGIEGDGGLVQVKQGLLDGEQVVTSAQFMLDSESQLQEAIQKMLNPEKETPAASEGSAEDLFQGGGKKKQENPEGLFK
jgi:Cu(I)/Ag(I) efflux system membrane fusion protein